MVVIVERCLGRLFNHAPLEDSFLY